VEEAKMREHLAAEIEAGKESRERLAEIASVTETGTPGRRRAPTRVRVARGGISQAEMIGVVIGMAEALEPATIETPTATAMIGTGTTTSTA